MKKALRKGWTTGACAAAAAKAAAVAFLTKKRLKEIQIALPIGRVAALPVHQCKIERDSAFASVIKDGGDDPDVTNGAEIQAGVRGQGSGVRGIKAFQFTVHGSQFTVYGGQGIGIVTKPGLAVKVGEPAINPVPREMIKRAVSDVFKTFSRKPQAASLIISVPYGEEIAKKTMNPRLGIMGGISILGTTGIVEPLSLSAYRHSISCAVDVAIASGCKELVFSTGRSSEKAAQDILSLPEEAFILVGDHMGYALKKVKGQRSKVKGIVIAGQFGKFSKLAAGNFETHCADSSIELDSLSAIAKKAGAGNHIVENIKNANTARQVFFIIKEHGLEKVFEMVCKRVQENSCKIADIKMGCILIDYTGGAAVQL